MRKQRLDSTIYQTALATLRDNHLDEFDAIRARLFAEHGLPIPEDRQTSELTRQRIIDVIAQCRANDDPVSLRVIAKLAGIGTERARTNLHKLLDSGQLVIDPPAPTRGAWISKLHVANQQPEA